WQQGQRTLEPSHTAGKGRSSSMDRISRTKKESHLRRNISAIAPMGLRFTTMVANVRSNGAKRSPPLHHRRTSMDTRTNDAASKAKEVECSSEPRQSRMVWVK